MAHSHCSTVYRDIFVGAKFRINGHKPLSRNFRILIFICACALPRPLALRIRNVSPSRFRLRQCTVVRGYVYNADIWASVKFCSFYFRISRLHMKFTKIITVQKFPTIWYHTHYYTYNTKLTSITFPQTGPC